MAIIVIGGQASGVGKTSVICALIAAMPERRWTAIKITQCNHGITQCSHAEKRCDCELGGRAFAISEESEIGRRTDTSRYLAAGAVRSLWVRTLPGHLGEAMPCLRDEIAKAQDVVIESNSVLEFLDPDLYALVVSPGMADFKPSAGRFLDRANAILIAAPAEGREACAPAWPDELHGLLGHVPRFSIGQAQFDAEEFVAFARRRFDALLR